MSNGIHTRILICKDESPKELCVSYTVKIREIIICSQ